MLRPAGTVSLNPDWVSAKAFLLLSVMVSVEVTFSPTLTGEKAALTDGAVGVTVMGVGQAVAAEPAADGAELVAPVEPNDTTAVSVLLAESVTVKVSVPAAPVDTTVTWAVPAPDWMLTPPVATQA